MANNVGQQNNTQTAFISFIDKETGNVLAQDKLTGQAGEIINYQIDGRVAELEKQGYSLDYSGLPKGARYSVNNGKNQVFAVLMNHDQMVINPQEAQPAGTPINPDDPNGAKWPDQDQYSRTYHLTIAFVDAQGKELYQPIVQQSQWQRQVTLDRVTGQTQVIDDNWQSNTQTYEAKQAPVITGYVTATRTIPQQVAVAKDVTKQVLYQPVGQIRPVLSDGHTPVPGVNPVNYQNDPDDPTKVLADQPVPNVDEFIADIASVRPAKPTVDTPVVYQAMQQHAVINFVDVDSGNVINKVTQHGKVGTMILYNPLDDLEKLTKQGYQMVKNGFIAGTTYQAGATQEFEIQMRKTNAAPKVATKKKSLTYTFTTHFLDQSGQSLHDDYVQNLQWTENAAGQYTPEHSRYQNVKVPVIDGYYADLAVVPGHIAGLFNTNYTVMYRKLGHFVPVDEQGQQIPGAPQPVYRNDQDDPTKIASKQAIPQINGYRLAQNRVNPADLSQDTQIVYHRAGN